MGCAGLHMAMCRGNLSLENTRKKNQESVPAIHGSSASQTRRGWLEMHHDPSKTSADASRIFARVEELHAARAASEERQTPVLTEKLKLPIWNGRASNLFTVTDNNT